MYEAMDGGATRPQVIRIVAALIQDPEIGVLLVRKRGTRAFMQPGGKLKDGEPHIAALERELREELRCTFEPASLVFLGMFTAAAANEPGCVVEAALYSVQLTGSVSAASEIEEVAWVSPHSPHELELAPLTREHVLPLARSRSA